jgi:type VI protein secretion system component VasK
MKKIITTILIIVLILLIIRFGPMLFKTVIHIGITILKIAIRFWYLWLAIVIYSALKDDSTKKRKKKSEKVEDAEFTIVEEDEDSEKSDKPEKPKE